VHRGRALPIVWRVLDHESASVSFETYQDLLYQAVERLPQDVKVVLLADRGFVHTNMMKQVTIKLGWHYRVRVKNDCWIWRKGKGCCQLKDFHFNPGEVLCLQNVRLHKEEEYGPVNIIFGRNNVNVGPLLVMKRRRCRHSRNTAYALILKRISWMINQMVGIFKSPRFAIPVHYQGYGSFWH